MVEFGIQLGAPTAEPMADRLSYYREMLEQAPEAFSAAWISDHLRKDDYPTFEGWTALTYLAALFPTYRVGNLVLSQSYRNDPADPSGTMASVSSAQDPTGLYANEMDWVMGPTPEDAVRQLRPLVELGVTMLSVYFHDRRSARLFAKEVVPAFA